MTKKNSKWESITDLILETPTTLEGIFVAIPYLILNSIVTMIKVIFMSLIAILTLNKWKKLNEFWNKKYLKNNIIDPWNFVLALVIIIFLTIIF